MEVGAGGRGLHERSERAFFGEMGSPCKENQQVSWETVKLPRAGLSWGLRVTH